MSATASFTAPAEYFSVAPVMTSVSAVWFSTIALAQAVRALRINTTSGSVSAFLPENPGFTARLGTTSGSVDYALPLNKQESEYVCGDGSGSVDIHTTSGNIRLERLE